ncbi:nitroreductase family deazaflavin-dependent oxidoreductase [Nocardia sp. NPDC024068]|uniref:nitroreductase family deazaflavin-dependent oxidoreductase n=1 Tax=Nocardia sp. NPDC024068 TaxID=3157197 RepID=UPI0033EC637D
MPDPANSEPARRYRRGRLSGMENRVMTALTRAGLIPYSYLLTTRGRRTGRPRHNPVLLVDHDERQWLVAPYGAVGWVHNARAAGRVTLTRRRRSRDYAIREVSADEAGPVLRHYLEIASATREYFRAERGDPVERFVAEAGQHPVFELTPL